MRILFDSQAFDMQTHGGVSRCFVELMRHLPDDVKAELSVIESRNEYLKQLGYPLPGEIYENFIHRGEFPGKGRLFDIWYNKVKHYHYGWDENHQYSIEKLKQGKFDVFHPTFFSDYFLPYLNGKPFVLTIHDMIPELYPQYFKADNMQIVMKKKLAPLASAIIVVSEQTKKDVIRILNVPDEKVHVIYHGAMEDVALDTIPEFSPFAFPYILYVGDRFGYKNFISFAKASAEVLKQNLGLKVVCTGKAFNDAELNLFAELGLSERFVHYFVPDNISFQSLYHHAKVFVYPSEYEGFGIPILEAYQADCPVLLNHASCFPEVAGEAAIFFNGFGENSNYSDRLRHALSLSAEDRTQLITMQRDRLKLYTWKKSAEQHADIYRIAASGLII